MGHPWDCCGQNSSYYAGYNYNAKHEQPLLRAEKRLGQRVQSKFMSQILNK